MMRNVDIGSMWRQTESLRTDRTDWERKDSSQILFLNWCENK